MKHPFASWLCILLLLAIHPAAVAVAAPAIAPHASWRSAPLSNGFGVGVYDTAAGKLTGLLTHPYAEATQGVPTPDLLWDAFFGVSVGGKGSWFAGIPPLTVAYENGTGILVVVREAGGLRFSEQWFAPMGLSAVAVAGVLTVENLGATPVSGVRLFSLHNLHLGAGAPEADASSERADWEAATGMIVERGDVSGRVGLAAPLVPAARHALSPPNPYVELTQSGVLQDATTSAVQDDLVTAFQWDAPADLAPGGKFTVGFLLGAGESADEAGLRAAIGSLQPAGLAVVDAERQWWKEWHAKDALPGTLAGDDFALARHSLAMLAMSQVREPNASLAATPHGQVLASLPPGMWNRTWPRDQSYATVALAAAGHVPEASDAAAFVLNGKASNYEAQVGRPYLVSVCRYYGHGGEESDGDPATDGPNIEFDGFGLYLWSVAEIDAAAAKAGSARPGDAWWPQLKTGVADVLVSLVQEDGLVRADSSIWERHWNGNQKHFAYTDATAVLGLCAAADLAVRAGDPDAALYRDSARRIADAMAKKLVVKPSNVLAGSVEEIALGKHYDASVVEAFNWGIFDAAGPVALASLDAWEQRLGFPQAGRGWFRNDDGDWYDRQEWIFIDLRVSTALRAAGRNARANEVAAWVRGQSRKNLDLVAELYTEEAADYEGAVPMAGFGAASFLLWLLDRPPAVDVAACLALAPADEATADEGVVETAVPDMVEVADSSDSGEPPADVVTDPATGAEDVASSGHDIAGVPEDSVGRTGGSGGCVAPGAGGGASGLAQALAFAVVLLVARRRGPKGGVR